MKLTIADKWLVGILFFLSIAGIGLSLAVMPSKGDQVAEISINGQLVKTVPLKNGYRDELRLGDAGHFNLIEIKDKKIRVREADCPDQVCVRMGWISTAPQQVVCLPNRVMVQIKTSQNDLDDISR